MTCTLNCFSVFFGAGWWVNGKVCGIIFPDLVFPSPIEYEYHHPRTLVNFSECEFPKLNYLHTFTELLCKGFDLIVRQNPLFRLLYTLYY